MLEAAQGAGRGAAEAASRWMHPSMPAMEMQAELQPAATDLLFLVKQIIPASCPSGSCTCKPMPHVPQLLLHNCYTCMFRHTNCLNQGTIMRDIFSEGLRSH